MTDDLKPFTFRGKPFLAGPAVVADASPLRKSDLGFSRKVTAILINGTRVWPDDKPQGQRSTIDIDGVSYSIPMPIPGDEVEVVFAFENVPQLDRLHVPTEQADLIEKWMAGLPKEVE